MNVEVTHTDKGFAEIVIEAEKNNLNLIDIRTPECMYIHIKDKIIYIDYSMSKIIVENWTA